MDGADAEVPKKTISNKRYLPVLAFVLADPGNLFEHAQGGKANLEPLRSGNRQGFFLPFGFGDERHGYFIAERRASEDTNSNCDGF